MQHKKQVYIIYTGGTIGMRQTAHGYQPEAHFLSQFLAEHPEFHRAEMPSFKVHEYSPLLDSSDMSPAHWMKIAIDIQENYAQYDAFIILHGTDTLAYTSSALHLILQNLDKPVIITGSQIPISVVRSDGQENLLNALYLANHYPVNGVNVLFNNQLLKGNAVTKINTQGFAAFASPNYPVLINMGIDIDIQCELINSPSHNKLRLHPIKAQPVSVLFIYPGIPLAILENVLATPVKALILLSYGVGNVPANDDFMHRLQQAIEQGIIIVNCTQCLYGKVNMETYANGVQLAQIGVRSAQDATLEACLTQLYAELS